MKASYTRFFAMIGASTAVMFVLMYTLVVRLGHVWWSQTRFWMALYMGAAMAVVMLAFMWSMYENHRRNMAIVAGAAVVFALGLWLARSQQTVGDVAWMKAMIPHHSIAILTSERAQISDPRVRALAARIVEAQRREIGEMEALIADLDLALRPPASPQARARPVRRRPTERREAPAFGRNAGASSCARDWI